MCRNFIADGCRTRYKLFAYNFLTGTLHTVIVQVRKEACCNGLEKGLWLNRQG